VPAVTLDSALRLDPKVSIRPEPFGALLYHFGTRRLSFLKSRTLLAVVQGLRAPATVRSALEAAGVPERDAGTYLAALETLVASHMLVEAED